MCDNYESVTPAADVSGSCGSCSSGAPDTLRSSHIQRMKYFDQSELIYATQNPQPNMSKVVITARGPRKSCFLCAS